MKSEYEYIMSNSEKLTLYLGKWISIVDEDIIASGKTVKEVYDKAIKKYANREPFIMKIPKETITLL